MSKLTADDVVLSLAASVARRSCELITDGWTKGAMNRKVGGAPVSFCIHGAIELAMEEMFGLYDQRLAIQRDVEQVVVAFICDEAFGSMKEARPGIPAATYNDAACRRHDEVIGVIDRAANRLWDVALDTTVNTNFEYSKWATIDEAQAAQYLNASLAN